MPKLALDRLKPCTVPSCNKLGIAQDFKCAEHTKIRSKSLLCTSYKNPFGVELELYVSSYSFVGRMPSLYECVGRDGSLCSSSNGVELKFIGEAHKVGRSAGHSLMSIKHNTNVFVDSTCGMHVHMDMKKYRERYDNPTGFTNSEMARKLYPYLSAIQEEVFSLFPTRSRRSGYSKTIRDERNLMTDRYLWMAITNRHPTLECRLHPGTTNPDIVIAWSKCCVQLQKLIIDILEGKNTTKTRAAKRGKFFTQFQKGTVARHYVDYRKDRIVSNSSANKLRESDAIEREYRLPCS